MFIDVRKKIKALEEEITRMYIKRGEYPSINTIDKHIKDLDPFKPLYRVKNMKKGDYLNAEILNQAQREIQKDIRILYESIYEMSVNEYIKLQTYLNSQIEELNRLVQQYTNRASILSNFSELGNTLYYKDKEFPLIRRIDHYEINLKTIKYMPNSYIGVIIDYMNMEEGDIFIEIGGQKIKPYNVNKDKLIIPYDNRRMNEHIFELEDNTNINSPIQIPLKNNKEKELKIDPKNKYIISSGHNQALVTYKNEQRLIDINSFEFEDEAIIEFYIINGSYINIRSNREYQYSNFNSSEESIKINNYARKIKIKTKPNTVINIDNYDGKIYGLREQGIVLDEALYYNQIHHNNKFFIEEYLDSERVSLPTKIILYPDPNKTPKINSIEIKESLDIGGGINDQI